MKESSYPKTHYSVLVEAAFQGQDGVLDDELRHYQLAHYMNFAQLHEAEQTARSAMVDYAHVANVRAVILKHPALVERIITPKVEKPIRLSANV